MTQTLRHAHFKTVVRRATFGFHFDTGVRRYSENRQSRSDICNGVGRNSSYGVFCRGGQSLVEGTLPDQMRSMSANISDFEQPAQRGLSLQIERVLLNNCGPEIGRNGVHSCGGDRRICRKHGERLWRWELMNSAGELGADIHTVSHRLHSATLESLGLEPGISSLCKEFTDRHGIEIDFAADNNSPCRRS